MCRVDSLAITLARTAGYIVGVILGILLFSASLVHALCRIRNSSFLTSLRRASTVLLGGWLTCQSVSTMYALSHRLSPSVFDIPFAIVTALQFAGFSPSSQCFLDIPFVEVWVAVTVVGLLACAATASMLHVSLSVKRGAARHPSRVLAYASTALLVVYGAVANTAASQVVCLPPQPISVFDYVSRPWSDGAAVSAALGPHAPSLAALRGANASPGSSALAAILVQTIPVSLLASDTSVVCLEGPHRAVFIASCVLLLCFILPWPMLLLYLGARRSSGISPLQSFEPARETMRASGGWTSELKEEPPEVVTPLLHALSRALVPFYETDAQRASRELALLQLLLIYLACALAVGTPQSNKTFLTAVVPVAVACVASLALSAFVLLRDFTSSSSRLKAALLLLTSIAAAVNCALIRESYSLDPLATSASRANALTRGLPSLLLCLFVLALLWWALTSAQSLCSGVEITEFLTTRDLQSGPHGSVQAVSMQSPLHLEDVRLSAQSERRTPIAVPPTSPDVTELPQSVKPLNFEDEVRNAVAAANPLRLSRGSFFPPQRARGPRPPLATALGYTVSPLARAMVSSTKRLEDEYKLLFSQGKISLEQLRSAAEKIQN